MNLFNDSAGFGFVAGSEKPVIIRSVVAGNICFCSPFNFPNKDKYCCSINVIVLELV